MREEEERRIREEEERRIREEKERLLRQEEERRKREEEEKRRIEGKYYIFYCNIFLCAAEPILDYKAALFSYESQKLASNFNRKTDSWTKLIKMYTL